MLTPIAEERDFVAGQDLAVQRHLPYAFTTAIEAQQSAVGAATQATADREVAVKELYAWVNQPAQLDWLFSSVSLKLALAAQTARPVTETCPRVNSCSLVPVYDIC